MSAGPDLLAGTSAARVSGRRRRNAMLVATLIATVATMVALTFASVPLYRLFCQVTGFGGTTQVAAAAPGTVASSHIAVRFDANAAAGLPWRFTAPDALEIRLGEQRQVSYVATNLSNQPVLGTAVFNVTPLQVGRHFYKIECFCFTEQLLMPGERKEFPVQFYVDPAIADDPGGRGVGTITLSYTFYNKGRAALDEYLRAHPVTASANGAKR